MPPAGPARLTWQRCAAFQGVRAGDLRSDSLPADGTGVGPAPPGNRRRRQRGDEREGVVLGLRRHLRDLRLSGKDQATRTWKSYGHHPLARLRRSRRGRAGETVGWLLRRRPGGRTPQQTIWWSSNRPSGQQPAEQTARGEHDLPAGAGPHRRRRRHPAASLSICTTTESSTPSVHPRRGPPRPGARRAGRRLDTGVQRRQRSTGRSLGRRDHRPDRAGQLTARDPPRCRVHPAGRPTSRIAVGPPTRPPAHPGLRGVPGHPTQEPGHHYVPNRMRPCDRTRTKMIPTTRSRNREARTVADKK